MKSFKFLIAAALFAVLLVSCEEGSDIINNQSLTGEYIQATIDGESFKSVGGTIEIVNPLGGITITGARLNLDYVILNIEDYSKTGTYVLDNILNPLNTLVCSMDSTEYTTALTPNSDNKIVVTKVSDGHIEGTFTATCKAIPPKTGTVTITNGVFSSNFEVDPAE